VPVLDIVGQNIKDVCEKGSARSPGRKAIVEKLPIQFSGAVALGALFYRKIEDVCGQGKALALALTPTSYSRKVDAPARSPLAVDEKPSYVRSVVQVDKVWLMQLTRNLCIDIIRQRSRGAAGVERIE